MNTQLAGVSGNSSSASAAAATLSSFQYRLNPQDVIDVVVFRVPDLTRTARVDADGSVSLPLIGEVQAAGKTVGDLESEIQQKLEERYLQTAQVTVTVKEYNSQKITIDGAVNSPGIYQLAGQGTLLRAIAQAKGLDRTADARGIVVFRNVDGAQQAAVFDLKRIRAGTAPDPELKGGDVVVVDQSAVRTALRDIRETLGVAGAFRPWIF